MDNYSEKFYEVSTEVCRKKPAGIIAWVKKIFTVGLANFHLWVPVLFWPNAYTYMCAEINNTHFRRKQDIQSGIRLGAVL